MADEVTEVGKDVFCPWANGRCRGATCVCAFLATDADVAENDCLAGYLGSDIDEKTGDASKSYFWICALSGQAQAMTKLAFPLRRALVTRRGRHSAGKDPDGKERFYWTDEDVSIRVATGPADDVMEEL